MLRQKENWQKEATLLFGKQQTQEAIHKYQDKGCIHSIEETIPSLTHARASQDRDKLHILYEMSARVSSRMYREMVKDKDHYPISQHPDYTAYLKWKSIEKATKPYNANLQRQPVDLRQSTKEELLKHWHAELQTHPNKSSLILAFSNKDVNDLNRSARFLLKQSGRLEKEEILYKTLKEIEDDFGKVHTFSETKPFSKGDRIVFTSNNYGLNVKNGTLGIIVELNKSLLRVKMDHEEREVSFVPALNPFFDHGWATTIHTSQGTTVDKAYVLASYEMNQNLTYVAMTRHREAVQVFGSSLDFWRPEKIPEVLSQSGEKLASHDYVDSHSFEKLATHEDRLLTKLFTRVSDELEAMGAVSKQAFWKTAHHFLGINRDKENQKDPIPTSVREETRAEQVLGHKSKKGFWKEASFEIKIPLFQKAIHYEGSPRNLENIAAFIEEKLYAINAYAGTRLAYEAKEELQEYMKMLGKDKAMFQALKNHNQQLIKEAQRLFQEQVREQERVANRNMDLSL